MAIDSYGLTDKGLRIQLSLSEKNHFVVVLLACSDLKDPGMHIGTRLSQVAGMTVGDWLCITTYAIIFS